MEKIYSVQNNKSNAVVYASVKFDGIFCCYFPGTLVVVVVVAIFFFVRLFVMYYYNLYIVCVCLSFVRTEEQFVCLFVFHIINMNEWMNEWMVMVVYNAICNKRNSTLNGREKCFTVSVLNIQFCVLCRRRFDCIYKWYDVICCVLLMCTKNSRNKQRLSFDGDRDL